MTRTDKIKALEGALSGDTGTIRQLQRKKQKDSKPFSEAHGIVDVSNCPEEFMDMIVYNENFLFYDDREESKELLRDFVQRFNDSPPDRLEHFGTAMVSIDDDDHRYDDVPLSFIEAKTRSQTYTYTNGTVSTLRAIFKKTAESVDKCTFFLIVFETRSWLIDVYHKRLGPATKRTDQCASMR